VATAIKRPAETAVIPRKYRQWLFAFGRKKSTSAPSNIYALFSVDAVCSELLAPVFSGLKRLGDGWEVAVLCAVLSKGFRFRG
jgi:hypothetical protein